MHSESGEEIYVTQDAWRNEILPNTLRTQWDDPQALEATIYTAVQDGFIHDILPAARHLAAIYPDHERAACFLGHILMKAGDLDGAQATLEDHITRHGRTGFVVTNLAKVWSARGEEERAFKLLREGLSLEPNQQNAVEWWAVTHREEGGLAAMYASFEEIAALPGSWRAELLLAKWKLEQGDLEGALSYYQEALDVSSAHADALEEISGRLGQFGHPELALELVAPHYRPDLNHAGTALNLARACMLTGRLEEAGSWVGVVKSLKRLDLSENVAQVEREIAAKQAAH